MLSPASVGRACSAAVLLLSILVSGISSASAQQGQGAGQGAPQDTTRSGGGGGASIQALQPPGGGGGSTGDTYPPSITFVPAGRTFYTAPQSIRIESCDNQALPTAPSVKFNGTSLTVSVTSGSKSGCAAFTYTTVNVTLLLGDNTLWARVCDGANNCTERSETFRYEAADPNAPVATISPATQTTQSSGFPSNVTITWCDDASLDPGSALIQLNGADVTASFRWTSEPSTLGCTVRAVSSYDYYNLQLQSGTNTVTAEVRDTTGNRSALATATIVYQPQISAAPTNGDVRTPGMFDAVLSYGAPAYVSLDQPRGVRFVYSSSQAAPTALVEVDVTDNSASPAPKSSIQILYNGSLLTLTNGQTEVFYVTGAGTNRLSALFDAANSGTGAYSATAVITRYWSDRSEQLTVPVRAIIVNEKGSRYGAGWTLAGVQRIHTSTDGVLITEGDGSAVFFLQECGTACTFASPLGDFTTLSRDPVTNVYTRGYPDGSRVLFSATGYMTRAEDRFGNATTYEHNGYSGTALTRIVDPAGRATTFSYNNGKLVYTTDPAGRRTTLEHSGANLIRITDAENVAALQPSYETGTYRLSGWIDRAGGQWNVTYDAWGKLASSTTPSFVAEGGQTFRLTSQFVSHDRAVLPVGAKGTSTAPADRVTPSNVRARITDPQGRVTQLALDRWGAPTIVRAPTGHESTFQRNEHGQLILATDPQGIGVGYSWTGAHLRRVQASGTTTEIYHGPYGQPGDIWVNQQRVATNFFNSAGVLTHLVQAGDTTSYVFDSRGRLRSVTDPEKHATTYVYADTSAWKNLESVTTGGNRQTSFRYDAYGRTRSVTADGVTATTEYDLLNRTRSVADTAGTILYEWGLLDLNRITDPRGQAYSWTRNALGWATEEARPGDSLGYHRRTAFDRYGRVASATNRRGQTIGYTYDTWDRVTRRVAGTDTTTYGYSPITPDPRAPRWRAFRTAVSTDTMHYDSLGRLAKTVTVRPTTAGNKRFVLEPRYDEHDQRVGLVVTFPTGARDSIGYAFDAQRRLSGLYDWGDQSTSIGYDGDGLPKTITLPGGQTITHAFASNHLPGSIHYSSSAVNAAAGMGLEYDALNRVTMRWNGARDRYREFQYSPASALSRYTDLQATSTTKPTCTWDPDLGEVCEGPTTNWSQVGGETFAFDAVGNPTDRGAALGGGNRLATFNGYSLSYDLDGNLTRKRLTASPSQFDQNLTWSPLGQLTKVVTTRSSGTGTVGYAYDGLGRRVRTTNPDGTVTSVLYDGDDLLLELAGDGSVRAKYMYYPGIDHPHSVVRGTQTAYFATDQVGSVTALFNSAGQVLNQYKYRPFGEMESVSEQIVNPLRFTAREYDTSTELYYYRNRWYDPQLGRFISEDPIGVAGGINAYAYVQNDPINYADPMGLICQAYTPTMWRRRYYNERLVSEIKEWSNTIFVGDCFKDRDDTRDNKGGDVREEEEELPGLFCIGTVGLAAAGYNDRRNKARRYDRERRRYEAARSRAAYLNELWIADIRNKRDPTESSRASLAQQSVIAQAAEAMRDARDDLNTANLVMGGTMLLAAGTCVFAP